MASSSSLLVRGRAFALVVAVALVAAPRRINGGAAGPAARTNDPNWHVFSVSSLLPSSACTASKAASNSSALGVVHRHGPCSPVQARRRGGGGAVTHAEILERDQARVDSIHRKVAGAGGAPSVVDPARASEQGVSLPAQRGISLGTGNYVVSVGLGTPAKQYAVIFDTGSDLSWVQCKPCADCYEQQDPLFDPSLSSTYAAVACGAPECQELDASGCSSDSRCRYEVQYGDQSQTDGNLVRDTLTLSASDTLPGFVFGCGDQNAGLFGQVDGLFGLGREKVSLPSQGAPSYGPGFTYCLPSSSSGRGYLSLGGAPPANAQFTALADGATPSFYYIDLVGIKVGGRAIRIPATAFAAAGGTVIDSGTVITRLPPRAYAPLRAAFARSMAQYKKAPALSILDTCYDFTGHRTAQIPTVELAFAGGATVSLDFTGVLYVSKVSQACLAFAPNADDSSIAILGNTQQKTFAVAYDVANQRIGFGAKGCS
ncbi:aspartyl protease family protein At5g10770-like [Oryza glaberrima]|uniref:Peptidase A1 domain-containing protein n=1 Tax=Oryza glaberrima TaxID=4538 RepID=I1QRZ4_ORYGL|nr:aspartyl protease family protein At5g10770-like [Oryza glaberrima]